MDSYLAQYGPRLAQLGYDCVPIRPGTKHPGTDNWQTINYTGEKLKACSLNGYFGGGVGIKTRNFPALDLDVHDEHLVTAFVEIIAEDGHRPPVRIGAKGCGLMFRTDEPFTKVSSARWTNPDDWENAHEHQLEILGDGQQIVAYGIHPGTGKPYTWPNVELYDTRPQDLPAITLDEARRYVSVFDNLCESLGWEKVTKGAQGRDASEPVDAFENLVPPRKMADGELDALLESIDPGDLDYDDWLKVGMAVYHQTQGDGLELFLDWSSRSWKHEEATGRAKWRSFKAATYGGKPVTVGSIEHMARVAQGKENVERLAKAAPEMAAVAKEPAELDLGANPERNAVAIKEVELYARHKKQSYRYDGKHWDKYSDEEFEAHVNGLCFGRGLTPAQVNHTITQVGRLSVRKDFSPDPARLAMGNGVVNLAGWDQGGVSLSLEPHDHRHNITSLLPFDFDPAATCPSWERFLDDVLPDESFQALLQEFIGYCLVWDYRHQKMLLMHGASRSGKGTIARVIERLCSGAFAGVSLSSMAADRGLVTLANAKVGIVGDAHRVEKTRIERAKESLLTITGQDSVSLDPKYKDAYSATIPARLVLLANEMPRFFDRYDALANRYLVLPFATSFAGREDVRLGERLDAELPGILLWALRGLERLGQTGAFTESRGLKTARAMASERNNPIGGFLTRYVVRDDSNKRLLVQDAFQEYRRFCTAFDHRIDTETAFGLALKGHLDGLKQTRVSTSTGKMRVYEGAYLDTTAVAFDLGGSDFDDE